MRETAAQGAKVDLALRALAEAEEIDVDDDDLDAEFMSVATRVGQKPAQVRKEFERNGQVPLVRSDLRKRKALDWLIEHVEIVDEQGNAIDRSALRADEEADEESPAQHGDAPNESTQTDESAPSHGEATDPQPEAQADAADTDAKFTEDPE